MKELEVIEEAAEQVLAQSPDPVVRFRLLRDVLRRPLNSSEVLQAREDLSRSHWAQELESEQWSDGSWGRFHSMDSKAKQKISTTEDGVTRALALGLDTTHSVLFRASEYITGILERTITWRDRPEVSWGPELWDALVRLISGATLAQIQPDLRVLDDVWGLWHAIIRRAFPSGEYDQEEEVQAHLELLGIKSMARYLRKRLWAFSTSTKYHVALLGSRADTLSRDLERAYVRRIWNLERGIGYLQVPLTSSAEELKKGPLERWMTSLEMLTPFPSWRKFAGGAIDKLWELKSGQGLWDLGARSSGSAYFPLSESWRKKGARQFDWTTRVLALLRKYCEM